MTGSVVTRKQKSQCRTKVKTGCATCRIRKIKCDEKKPFCGRCLNTGRTCDGYESPFRTFTVPPIKSSPLGNIEPENGLQLMPPTLAEVAFGDTKLFNRYFSTKTLFDVELGLDEEARQVLQASLDDPPIRHALMSLKALREDLEISGDASSSLAQQTPDHHYGLQQYSMALGGLASNLSSPGSNELKSALICCQIFISIEQVQKNYATMAQHIIRGLRIMKEYRARPELIASNELVPAHHGQLPYLDVFIIKLFAAPCNFAEPLETNEARKPTSSMCLISPPRQPLESRDLRTIVPDMRTELTSIAMSTIGFLSKVSKVESVGVALRLLPEKEALLHSLESWLIGLDLFQKKADPPRTEPISVSFLRLFHFILKVVLLGVLECRPDRVSELRIENERLQDIANNISERVSSYVTCSGSTSGKESAP